jgi:hypothetical protein
MESAEAELSRLFFETHGFIPNLKNPTMLSEKIQYRKLYERDPRMPRLTDKVAVKEHVSSLLGPDWIVPIIWSGRTLPPLEERDWPTPYVLKANHGSGWNIFIWSAADQRWNEIETTVRGWLGQVYGQHLHEWLYKEIEPQLLIEPYIGPSPNVFPINYRFLVFDGYAPYLVVNSEEQGGLNSIYDRNWKYQAANWGWPGRPQYLPRPHSFSQMISAAESLGKGFPFVRIDFYEMADKPFFGEMTFYPCSGLRPIRPRKFDRLLGDYWSISQTEP